jgi:hypothetical protein
MWDRGGGRSPCGASTLPCSRYDPLTNGARQPRELERAVRSRDGRLEIVDGDAHGVELLIHGALVSELTEFLGAHH